MSQDVYEVLKQWYNKLKWFVYSKKLELLVKITV